MKRSWLASVKGDSIAIEKNYKKRVFGTLVFDYRTARLVRYELRFIPVRSKKHKKVTSYLSKKRRPPQSLKKHQPRLLMQPQPQHLLPPLAVLSLPTYLYWVLTLGSHGIEGHTLSLL